MAGVRPSGFNQFDEQYDQPFTGRPSLNYAICATQRSGSHFLGHLMYSTGKLGYPLEYLHPPHFERWKAASGKASASDVMRYIASRRTSPNGCFGMKLHYTLLETAMLEFDFDDLFPQCRFVLIERDDLLGQAISFVRAEQTGQWISLHAATGSTRYDFDAILRVMHFLIAQRASWRRFFAVTGRPFHAVRYEALDANPQAQLQAVADHLGVGSVAIQWDEVLPERQSDTVSDVWRERFLADMRGRPLIEAVAALCLAGVDSYKP